VDNCFTWDYLILHLKYCALEPGGGQCYVGGMEIRLPPDAEAHLAALAASTGHSTDELVQEALALWEQRRAERQGPRQKHTPAEAAARIRELRKGNVLPEGETIKDLINYGRA